MFRHLTIRRDFAVTISVAQLLVSSTFTSSSRAQQAEDPNVVAGARALAVEGVKLAQDGHCDDAIDKLERAEQLRHSAIVLEQLGECYIEKGRFVEGAEAMRSVLREAQPENASEALKKAHANARTMLDTAKAKIAMLTITVDVAGKAQPEVEIDGQPMPAALIGAARPTDPGDHTIAASAPGHLPARRRVTLTAGQTDTLALALVVDPNATAKAKPAPIARAEAPAAPVTRQTPAPLATPAVRSAPNHVPAYIVWGVGGAALAVGIAYGWVAMNQKSDLDKVCPNQRCPPIETERLDAAKANGVISSIAFGVGLGAAVTGGLLFFLADGSAAEKPQPAAAGARLNVGPGAAELSVKF